MRQVEKWGMLELTFQGQSDGNPYMDYQVQATFTGEKETKKVTGFYNGNGEYKVRFMPSFEGRYIYEVTGDCLIKSETDDGFSGEFEVTPNEVKNHGPVRVIEQVYLTYEDGTVYHSVGTTCYAWAHQKPELQEQTLETLKNSCFNKLRFCIFPKFYQYNEKEPMTYPYKRGERKGFDEEKYERQIKIQFPKTREIEDVTDFDYYNFNEEYFKHFDEQIAKLCKLGIEADIILFHPYDKWGFCSMKRECNELYLNYMIARYGAFRNVWWSMANEYDLTNGITPEEWKALGELVEKTDPYGHLRSIHNCMNFYDFTEDWVTHCSLQKIDYYKPVEDTIKYIKQYKKPVVWDEIVYEGNIDMGWGNISGQELVRRFWESTLRGGYAGHGETFVHPEDILWWSHGGTLHGESEPRIAFLKKIWDEVPGGNLKGLEENCEKVIAIRACDEKKSNWFETTWCDFEIHYFGFQRPSYHMLALPEDAKYLIDIIDTWNMTVTDAGVYSGLSKIELPGREWMAIRLKKVN